jgi:programmed cell death 6-interacting protein
MQSTLSTNLTRARRDNDLIYLALVPPAGELPSISGVMLVKPTLPAEIKDSLSWLMKEGGGLGWEGLVDYGVHVAISERLCLSLLRFG